MKKCNLEDTVSLIEDTLQDMENDVYNFTRDGKCVQCGRCCSNILWLSQDEKEMIHRYVKKHHIKECKHLIPTVHPDSDAACPFLDMSKKKGKCMIYEVRPEVCRSFICSKKQRDLNAKNNERTAYKYEIVFMREEFF